MRFVRRTVGVWALAFSLLAVQAQAGPIFLTGHDPDFHAQSSGGAQNFLTVSLDYVMGGLLNDNVHKFLWVESLLPAIGGHVVGANSLPLIGLTAGVDYDIANGTALPGINLGDYTAIAVASTFGGMLTSAELNALIARSADIAAFINAGGGLFASAECEAGFSGCDDGANLAAAHGPLFGFLPVLVSSVATAPPYNLTPFGAGFGFSAAGAGYINECCTHNSFGAIAGLNIVDSDSQGHATSLAGVVTVDGGGFTPVPVPEPSTITLVSIGLFGYAGRRLRNRRSRARQPTSTSPQQL
jgi:hypothetical protein